MNATAIALLVLFPKIFNKLAVKREAYLSPFLFIGPIMALAISGWIYFTGPIELMLAAIPYKGELLFNLALKLDILSSLIATTVMTIGCVVLRFSIKYLDDDPKQKKFLANMSNTLSSVLIMLCSHNFILFFLAWISTSYFLHQLLTHFSERPGAMKAANQKFFVSRLGDLFLFSSMVIFFNQLHTLEFSEIIVKLEAMDIAKDGLWLNFACAFLILGAMTKSAQYPFHFWLPNTMETPTPVSALMHAGIINAGGYLVIRTSSILVQFPHTLDILAVIGGFSAVYGAMVMLTQSDVKRSLAYSTIAQMGFMMLQCGLGAFAVATLHIIGHAFYKAYAFLSSSTATDYGLLARYYPSGRPQAMLWKPFVTAGFSFALLFGLSLLLQIDLTQKPGAFVLTVILSLAMGQTLLSTTNKWEGFSYASLICLTYFGLYKLMSIVLYGSIAQVEAQFTAIDVILFSSISLLFIGLYVLQNNLEYLRKTPWGVKLYVNLYTAGK
jgi:NAD(P)H-quinone oxidoreductase subunit 5